jgi:hypothetical protein
MNGRMGEVCLLLQGVVQANRMAEPVAAPHPRSYLASARWTYTLSPLKCRQRGEGKKDGTVLFPLPARLRGEGVG